MKYLDGICRVNEDTSFGSIWKSYAPEDYRPGTTEYNTFSRDEFVGWSGIAPITMLIENIIGFRFFADTLPSHKILTYKIDITKVEDIPEEFRVWINRSDP